MILLFLPVLQMVGDGGATIDLSRISLPGFQYLSQFVPLGGLLLVIIGLTALQLLFNRSKAVYLSDLIHDFTNHFRLSLIVSTPMTLLSYGFGVLALALMRPFRKLAGVYGNNLQAQRQRQSHAVSEFVGSLKMARSMNLERRNQDLFGSILGQTKADARQFTRQPTIGSGLFQLSVVAGAAVHLGGSHLGAAGYRSYRHPAAAVHAH